MAYDNEQTLEAFKKLPEDVKEAMFSVDTVEVTKKIGAKHKLMIDKIGELADETGLVMLGFTHPSQFISNLADRLEVDKTIAKEIGEEINSKVFYPIREKLKKIHGMEPPEDGPREKSPAPESHPIFEAKTKEEISRSPMQISEKNTELQSLKPREKKIDPYHEPI